MNNQEIFAPEERDENTERKRELIELIASEEAILIVGAGSSVRLGYPDWHSLIKKLEVLANECGADFKPNEGIREEDSLRFLKYVEDIKSHIGHKTNCLGRYHDWLYELFQPKPRAYDEFHGLLVELPVRGILTTNYDTVLEEALLEKKRDSERKGKKGLFIDETPLVIGTDPPRLIHEFLLRRSNDPQIPLRIAHLHGMYRNPESIILSFNDYIQSYGLDIEQPNQYKKNKGRWTLHRKVLWSVLATRRVIFVGFSMNDPYFNLMLKTVSSDLWGWNKSIHFSIMSISPDRADHSKGKAKKLKSEYGVDTVFYEDYDGWHLPLGHIVAEIAAECGVEIQSTIIPQVQLNQNDCSVDEAPESAASESGDVLNWLEKNNQGMERRIDGEN